MQHVWPHGISLPIPEQLQNIQEQLNDVNIQLNGCKDIIVHTDGELTFTHDHLRVVDEIKGEKKYPAAAVNLMHKWRLNEHAENAENHQAHQRQLPIIY